MIYKGQFKNGLMEDDHGKLILDDRVIFDGKFEKG
jgi:hypothetical protein